MANLILYEGKFWQIQAYVQAKQLKVRLFLMEYH